MGAPRCIVSIKIVGCCRVINETPRFIHIDHHIDDGMFDGLEEPDGPIKLLPDFCILSGSLELPLACSSHIGRYKRCQRGRGGEKRRCATAILSQPDSSG